MKDKHRKNLLVGIFVALGFLIFISTIYLVGKKENIFGSTANVYAIFKDAKGLRAGDKVRLSGIDIGTVSTIGFLEDNRVIVSLSLEQETIKYLKKNALATIANEGLMGSKVVKILPGTITEDPVGRNDTIKTIEQIDIDDIMQKINESSENITVVTEELIDITQKINRGEGIFGKIFTDTTFTQNLDESSKNIAVITSDFVDLIDKVNRGQGIVGKIFADTAITADIDSAGQNINEIALNIMKITDKINQGEGIFGRLFTDTSLTNNLFASSQNLEIATSNLKKLSAKLTNDSSALNLFINDTTFKDSLEILINNLNIGILEVTEAADAVEKSGIVRLFSKKKKDEKKKDEKKNE
ncbi:MAG: MlaD family protein [Bacteroidales bacterium]|nr:MlaD family protein [Bacteroidales bacterium]